MPDYNLALLCIEQSHKDIFCNISQNLAKIASSTYVLGVNSLPHVSVCHFQAEEGQLQSIWENAKDIVIDFILKPNICYWFANNKNDGTRQYTGIGVEKSDKLLEFQLQIANIIKPAKSRNEVGTRYFPHFTLGYNDLSQLPNILSVMQSDNRIWKLEIPVSLALGSSGLDGQFEKIIFS